MQRGAGDLCGVYNTSRDEVFVCVSRSVETEASFAFFDFVDDNGTIVTSVFADRADGCFERTANDLHTKCLLGVAFEFCERNEGADVCNTTTGDDAFFNSSASCVECIFNAGFFLFHLNFSDSTDFDDSNTTDEFRETFLQLLTIVVACSGFDLLADLLDATFECVLGSSAINECCGVFVDGHGFCSSELVEGHFFKFPSEVFADQLAASEDREIFEHCFTTIAEAGSFDCADVECTAEFVDDESRERFAFDVLCDDHQGTTGASNLLKDGKKIFHVGDLFLVQKDVGVFENCFHTLGVSHEVGGEVTTVKLHTFDNFEVCVHAFTFFNSDDAFFTDFVHRVCDDVTNVGVAVCGDRSDLSDLFAVFDGLGDGVQLVDDQCDGFLDATLELHGVVTSCDKLDTFAVDSLCEDRRCCGSVTSNIRSLGSDFFDHLSAHVLEAIFQLDLFCNGHTVFCHNGRAEGLFDHDVAAFGSESYAYCVCENVDTLQDVFTCILAKADLFRHWIDSFMYDFFSLSEKLVVYNCENVVFAENEVFFSIEIDLCTCILAKEDLVAFFDVECAA